MSEQQSCVYPLQFRPGDKIRVDNRSYTVHGVDPAFYGVTPHRGMPAMVGIETKTGTYITLPVNAQIEVSRTL